MFERRDINWRTVNKFFAVKVAPDQTNLVATNEITLAQAAYYPGAFAWGLWDDETPVGLLAMIKIAEDPEFDPAADDANGAYIWRLLVGKDQQGKGIGGFALEQAAKQAADWGMTKLYVSVVDADSSNLSFYETRGFTKTGRIVDEEIELAKDV